MLPTEELSFDSKLRLPNSFVDSNRSVPDYNKRNLLPDFFLLGANFEVDKGSLARDFRLQVFSRISFQYGPLPRQYGPLPRQYGPLPRQYGPLPRQYGPLPRQYGPLPRQYGPLPRQNNISAAGVRFFLKVWCLIVCN